MANNDGESGSLSEAVKSVLANRNFSGNPYFVALREGHMSLENFRRSQAQFFFAVTFFPRPMAALVGRIVDPLRRLDILRNLVEEHGDFDASRFHHTTFQQFLSSLDIDVRQLEHLTLWPEVRAFNSCLSNACVLDELEVGLACMGIIEQAFAGISVEIGRSVCARAWVSAEQLVHYRLHAEMDQRHAGEFFAVIEPVWADTAKRYLIMQGLELGAYIFERLYRDIFGRLEMAD